MSTDENEYPCRLAITVGTDTFPSRVQPWILNSIEQLVKRGGDCTIFAFRSSGNSCLESYKRLSLDRRTCYVAPGRATGVLKSLQLMFSSLTPFGPAGRRGLTRIMKSHPRGLKRLATALALAPAYGLDRTDLIHCHTTVMGCYMADVSRALGVPIVLTFHGLPPSGVPTLSSAKYRELFGACSRILVNTRFAREQAIDLGADPERIRILPQGLPIDRFPYQPTAWDPSGPCSILTVGRLHPDKGHRYAIEALAILKSRGYNVEYRIVGVGPLRKELQQFAAEMRVGSLVHFLGELTDSELRAEYRKAHIFVLPSVRDQDGYHEETQGVVLQEAQASGTIVVATRTGGIPECLDDGRSAFLADDRDSASLAAVLDRVISSPCSWPRWQALGRQWVEENFDIGRIGQQQWDIFLETLAESKTSFPRDLKGN